MTRFLDLDPTVVRGMVDELNDELLGTVDGGSPGRKLSELEQRTFAQKFVRELIDAFQDELASSVRPKLDSDGEDDLKRAVLDMSFQRSELWMVWRANPDILNLRACETGPIRVEKPNGTVEALPPVALSDTALRDKVMGSRAAAAVMTVDSQPELRLDRFAETYPAFVVPMAARRANAEGTNGVTLGERNRMAYCRHTQPKSFTESAMTTPVNTELE